MKNVSIFLFLLLMPFCADSGTLGVVGPTYPIIETDLLKLIEKTMQAKVDSGEWAKILRGGLVNSGIGVFSARYFLQRHDVYLIFGAICDALHCS